MSWEDFNLDKIAHELVKKYKDDEALKQVYKMRSTVHYGLERFWGEQLRLKEDKNNKKSQYWADTWDKLVITMHQASIQVPRTPEDLWDSQKFPLAYRKVTLSILTQLCDYMVWWTQRYKPTASNETDQEN